MHLSNHLFDLPSNEERLEACGKFEEDLNDFERCFCDE